MRYLAVLGRQPEISVAELEALGFSVEEVTRREDAVLAKVEGGEKMLDIARLGGTIKLAKKLEKRPLEYLGALTEGKITFGISDYSRGATGKAVMKEELKLKRILMRHGRSVRIVENKNVILSSATSLHNGMSGKNPRKVEFLKLENEWYVVVGVQDIDAYSRRDQARPARDAKVGMLPPKLAQILINLCGVLPEGARILDPFCGTGVVLQEALLMGYRAYGTDVSERMVKYSKKNLEWLMEANLTTFLGPRFAHPVVTGARPLFLARELRTSQKSVKLPSSQLPLSIFKVEQGDATSFQWEKPIDAVVCEGYLGAPMSQIPGEMKLKEQKQECRAIMLGFLRNLAEQIQAGTPVVVAMPAWRQKKPIKNTETGGENDAESQKALKEQFSRLNILDDIEKLGYNVSNKSREGLLYCRSDQIVARDIIILRKK